MSRECWTTFSVLVLAIRLKPGVSPLKASAGEQFQRTPHRHQVNPQNQQTSILYCTVNLTPGKFQNISTQPTSPAQTARALLQSCPPKNHPNRKRSIPSSTRTSISSPNPNWRLWPGPSPGTSSTASTQWMNTSLRPTLCPRSRDSYFSRQTGKMT